MAKATKRDVYEAIIMLATQEGANFDGIPFYPEAIVDFCNHEIELLDKKYSGGSRKPTKTQVENEGHKAKIIEVLTALDQPVTIKEIQAEAPELSEFSTSKMSALLTALIKAGIVERTLIKRVAHFSMAAEEEAAE